jgi:hypothetical protein
MSRKLTALIVGVVASLALVAGTMQGCGSSSSGTSNVALCEMVCDKVLECNPDAGTAGQQTLMLCKQNCASQVPTTTCTNASAITSAIQACLPMACGAYLECLTGVPPCQGGTGGTGGSTGTGGAGGAPPAGDCSVCTKADACCAALDANANCVLASLCAGAAPAQQASVISACQGVLNVAVGQPTAPAACR